MKREEAATHEITVSLPGDVYLWVSGVIAMALESERGNAVVVLGTAHDLDELKRQIGHDRFVLSMEAINTAMQPLK